jgi:hypothetical protein
MSVYLYDNAGGSFLPFQWRIDNFERKAADGPLLLAAPSVSHTIQLTSNVSVSLAVSPTHTRAAAMGDSATGYHIKARLNGAGDTAVCVLNATLQLLKDDDELNFTLSLNLSRRDNTFIFTSFKADPKDMFVSTMILYGVVTPCHISEELLLPPTLEGHLRITENKLKDIWFEAIRDESLEMVELASVHNVKDDLDVKVSFPAALLRRLSVVMERMLDGEMKEGAEKKIQVPEKFQKLTLAMFDRLVRKPSAEVLHCLDLLNVRETIELYEFLSMYEFELWIPLCVQLLCLKLDDESDQPTLWEVLEFASLHQLKSVMKNCLRVLSIKTSAW